MNVEIKQNSEAYGVIFRLVEEELSQGKNVSIAFSGESMLPTIRQRDSILVAPLKGELSCGDILLFRFRGHYIVHRLIEIEEDVCTMQGDNNIGKEIVRRSDILGRVIEVRKANGKNVGYAERSWMYAEKRAIWRRRVRVFFINFFGKEGRMKFRLWYFLLLAFLMWAPLNGVGIPLNNYILGLRADHLLHASIYVPCTLYLLDIIRRRWMVWLAAVGIGVLTELVQYILPYRGFDINDMVANILGVSLGWIIVLCVMKKRKKSRS